MPTAAGSGLPPVFTLADLERWSMKGVFLGVIGHPIGHSISPPMHNAALAAMAEEETDFGNWEYHRFDIKADQLGPALDKMHSLGFRGLNLTIPHKVEAVALLTEIDPAAEQMGAVNTLLWQPQGYKGFNTDGYGLEQALLLGLDVKIENETIILLGAGGAARAAAIHCLQKNCREIWVGNRNQDRLQRLLTRLGQVAPGAKVNGFDLAEPIANLPSEGVLINATSLGLGEGDPSPISLQNFSPRLKVLDMVYNPPETRLLEEARSSGMVAINGLSMLVWQGVRSLEIWTGRVVPVEEMHRAAARALAF